MDPLFHGDGYIDLDPEFRRDLYGYGRSDNPHPCPQDIYEAAVREVEKERIREEIIMSEIVRRRVLEAEVRRELMMERETAMRQGTYAIPDCSLPSLLATKAGRWSAEERLGMALENKEKLERSENGRFEALLSQRWTADLSFSETKLDQNVSGSKTEDVTSPEVVNFELLADVIANKKAKEEWSCAVCQVMASSEMDLNAHLLGNRHKLNMAALRDQMVKKNYRIGLFPKKATKSVHVKVKAVKLKPQHLSSHAGKAISKKDDLHVKEEAVKLKAQHLSSQTGKTISKKDDVPLSKNSMSGHLKKAQADKKSQLSCALCQVTASSENNLNDHVLGKGHKSKVAELRAQRTGKNHSIPTKATKPIHMGEEGLKLEVQTSFIEKPEWRCALCQVIASSENNLNEHVLGKGHQSKVAELRAQRTGKNHSIPTKATKPIHMGEEGLKLEVRPLFIEKPEWRCALCQVIASSENNLNEHMLGKGHKSRVAELRAQRTGKNHSIPTKATKRIA